MISCNPLHINFINFPAGIWETTRSRSSRQGYFQIYLPCKPCKLTKHHSFVYYFITDLEESEDLFWHQRIGDGSLGGWGGDSTVCWLPIVWLRFSAFFFFFKLVKSVFQPQSFVFKKIKSDESNHFWINRNSGSIFRLFPSCYISELLCPVSYFSDNHALLTIAQISLLLLLCPAFLFCNFFKPGLGERFLLCSLPTNLR